MSRPITLEYQGALIDEGLDGREPRDLEATASGEADPARPSVTRGTSTRGLSQRTPGKPRQSGPEGLEIREEEGDLPLGRLWPVRPVDEVLPRLECEVATNRPRSRLAGIRDPHDASHHLPGVGPA